MQVQGLHHVNVNVRDLSEALAFYVDGLGFAVLPRPDFGFPGAWLQMGAHQLHLVEAPEAVIDRGQHFALEVADLDAACHELDAAGIDHQRRPHRTGAGRQVFLRDPSGNLIELNQPDRG